MSEPEIVYRVEKAFKPYLKSPNELDHIRDQIAGYIESLLPQDNAESADLEQITIPSHVTGIRKRYLIAHYNNLRAKKEYGSLRELSQTHDQPVHGGQESTQILQAYVELLRSRKQQQKYQILHRYLSQAEALAENDHLYEQQFVTLPSNSVSTDLETIDDGPLIAQARELTRGLEVAVVQANHHLKRERQLLEEAKSCRSRTESPSPETKRRALLATRAELTAWIEESLARCDATDEANDIDDSSASHQNHDLKEYHRAITEQYEMYLKARTRLLDAATALTTTLPPSLSESAQKQPSPETATHEPTTSTATTTASQASILPYLDSQHLALLQTKSIFSQTQRHLESIQSKHQQDLHEQLLRLGDESHLLPAYPILAKSKQPETSSGDMDSLLHAWKFAMEAAGTATEATVEKQIRIGEKAVEEANFALDRQREVDEMWASLRQK